MNDARHNPRVTHVFHPTDFSGASEVAFRHALKIALVSRARLSLLHVARHSGDVAWSDFPAVRRTLGRWGLIADTAPRRAVADLGIDVCKVISRHDDAVQSSLEFLRKEPADLIVLATGQHRGRTAWLARSVAEPIARESTAMTLFLPHDAAGFVSATDGNVALDNLLVAVDHRPDPQRAIDGACRAAALLERDRVTFTVAHIGDADHRPTVAMPEQTGWRWRQTTRQGDVVAGILGVGDESQADLLVMSTAGHHGFLDALRGSTTERVLRGARCPLLAVPAG